MADEGDLRHQAIKRIRAKQSFTIHLTVFVVVNLMFVAIWFFTSRDYYWPIWPMLGWSIGLFFHWFAVNKQMDIPESRIQAEMDQLRRNS